MKSGLIAFGFLLFHMAGVYAQELTGRWKTVDDDTGNPKSIVELYEDQGVLYGKIISLLLAEDQGKICVKCSGSDYNQPLEGLIIVKGFTKGKDKLTYEGGTIFDPKNGKEYKCKMWIDDSNPNVLNVRGYVGFFYRTQKWYRVDGNGD